MLRRNEKRHGHDRLPDEFSESYQYHVLHSSLCLMYCEVSFIDAVSDCGGFVKVGDMQNDAGEYVDMYIPRKWFVIMPVCHDNCLISGISRGHGYCAEYGIDMRNQGLLDNSLVVVASCCA